jgi:hypothetical protein
VSLYEKRLKCFSLFLSIKCDQFALDIVFCLELIIKCWVFRPNSVLVYSFHLLDFIYSLDPFTSQVAAKKLGDTVNLYVHFLVWLDQKSDKCIFVVCLEQKRVR